MHSPPPLATRPQGVRPRRRIRSRGAVLLHDDRLFTLLDEWIGALTEDRGAEGSGEEVLDSFVRLRTRKYVYSGFVVGNWSPLEPLDLTAAASLNHTQVVLRDQGPDNDLDGNHRFTRLKVMPLKATISTKACTLGSPAVSSMSSMS